MHYCGDPVEWESVVEHAFSSLTEQLKNKLASKDKSKPLDELIWNDNAWEKLERRATRVNCVSKCLCVLGWHPPIQKTQRATRYDVRAVLQWLGKSTLCKKCGFYVTEESFLGFQWSIQIWRSRQWLKDQHPPLVNSFNISKDLTTFTEVHQKLQSDGSSLDSTHLYSASFHCGPLKPGKHSVG